MKAEMVLKRFYAAILFVLTSISAIAQAQNGTLSRYYHCTYNTASPITEGAYSRAERCYDSAFAGLPRDT